MSNGGIDNVNESDRILGKVEEGIEWLKEEIKEIKTDVKALNQFKWKVAGGAVVLSVLSSMLMTWAIK
jgi:hypothetical protein